MPPVGRPLALGVPARGQRRRRPRRIRWPLPILAAGALTLSLSLQLTRPLPTPTLHVSLPTVRDAVGSPPALPWPKAGEAAVSVPGAGLLLPSGPETPVPVASLTKVMTAYLVLRDHPLSPTAQGPTLTMTAANAADANADAAADATAIPIVAGEQFTERQLLDAMLVHSANDVADALAVWDAGSAASFVAKMNAAAKTLGMTGTHYVDPSGINPGDVSTAGDQLKLADVAMTIPTFAAVVAQPAVTIPGSGVLSNYVQVVGTDGVVGVKSGFTQAAMGCLVLAADRQVGGRQVLVLAAVTGQQGVDPLGTADAATLSLVDAVTGGLSDQGVLPAHRIVGSVRVPWDPHGVGVATASAVDVLVWPGTRWSVALHPRPVRGAVAAGDQVGALTVTDGVRRFTVALVTTAGLPGPSMRWRLLH